MKKLIAMVACATMACCLMTRVSAESGVNEAEQRVLDYFAQGLTVNGDKVDLTQEEYATLENYFTQDGIDLSETDADLIRDTGKKVQAFLAENWEEAMTIELINELIDIMKPATDVLGMSVTYDALHDTLTVLGKDGVLLYEEENFAYVQVEEPSVEEETTLPSTQETPSQKPTTKPNTVGGTVSSGATKLENTGENFTSTYAIFAGLGVVVASAGAVVLRKKEHNA